MSNKNRFVALVLSVLTGFALCGCDNTTSSNQSSLSSSKEVNSISDTDNTQEQTTEPTTSISSTTIVTTTTKTTTQTTTTIQTTTTTAKIETDPPPFSLDDNGAGIQFCVFCYNVQPNIGINYSDGESWSLIEETTEPIRETPPPQQQSGTSYVLNTNTHKFHYPSCSSVDKMKDKNKQYYTGTRDEVIAMGYDPCQRCCP